MLKGREALTVGSEVEVSLAMAGWAEPVMSHAPSGGEGGMGALHTPVVPLPPLPTVVLARMEGPKGLPAPVTTCTLTLPCSTVVKLRESVPPPGMVEPGGGERT